MTAAERVAYRAGWRGPFVPPMMGGGMFDGVLQQAQTMFDTELQTKLKPMFDQLVAELEGARGADTHLDASVAALQHSVDANTAYMAALIQQMKAVNAHPAIANRPAPATVQK